MNPLIQEASTKAAQIPLMYTREANRLVAREILRLLRQAFQS